MLGLLVLAGGGLTLSPVGQGVTAAIDRRAASTLARLRPPDGPPATVTITVDPTRILRPINPLIYGVSVATQDNVTALGARLNRWGGNPNTRYNWELGSAWNAARDWEFRNYGQDGSAPSAPASAADRFVSANRTVNVATELSVPAIGWVARNGDSETRSLNVPATGGPPLALLSDAIAGYDPTPNRDRTSLPSVARKPAPFADPPDLNDGHVYQDEWVHHLVDRFGPAAAGGVGYYAIDNEPDLWSATHTDVHPVRSSYDDVLASFIDYAGAIKAVDPTARVVGPTLSGWAALFDSARDAGARQFDSHPDREAHGNMPFLPWWLEQVRRHDQQTGVRLLDVLDVHYYPQASGVFSAADDAQTSGLRLRSTRSLWDPTYVDESWIGDTVRLIPRLRGWVDQYYPGTQLAIGEWNWGGEQSASGALAVADVLGIFGREGVDMAAYWTSPPLGSPAAEGFKMYTNYDRRGHGFGDSAVAAEINASPDDVAVYASVDSGSGDTVIVVINKRSQASVPATLRTTIPVGSSAEVFRYAPTAVEIQDVGQVEATSSTFSLVLPASSITLLHLSRGQ